MPKKRTRRRKIIVIAAAMLLPLFAYAAFISWPTFAHLNEDDVAEIKIIAKELGGERPVLASTDRPDSIRAFLTVLQDSDVPLGTFLMMTHRCLAVAEIAITRKTGKPLKLEWLYGHEETLAELRYNGRSYRVDRAELESALMGIGCLETPHARWKRTSDAFKKKPMRLHQPKADL